MEPPAKRMRMWKPRSSLEDEKPSRLAQAPPQHVAALPTRTIDLSDFQRRSFHMPRDKDEAARLAARNKGKGIYLMPRAPQATVTAKVIDVSVVDGGGTASWATQIIAPASDLVLTIGNLGTLTVPGSLPVTSTSITSALSDITSIPLPPIITTDTTSSAALNTTARVPTGEVTVTVTATSAFSVSVNNGTLIAPARTVRTGTASSETSTGSSTDSDSSSASPTGTDSNTPAEFSAAATPTDTGAGAGAGIAASGTGLPSSTSTPNSGEGDGGGGGGGTNLTPQQQQVVGGVVGSVAGVAIVLLALLYFLKWYRQRLQGRNRLTDQFITNREIGHDSDRDVPPTQVTTEKPRDSFGPIAVVASRLKQLRPFSTNTVSSNATTSSLFPAESERSFQRVAGRKIPPVLTAGGDGYGGNYGVFDERAGASRQSRPFSESSAYSHVVPDEVSQHRVHRQTASTSDSISVANPFLDPPATSSSPPGSPPTHNRADTETMARDFGFVPAATRPSGHATLRPSPARTPVTQSPTTSFVNIPQPISTPPLLHGDVPDLPAIPSLNPAPKGRRNFSRPHNSYSARDSASGVPNFSTRSISAVSRASGVSGRSSSAGGRFKEDID